MLLLLFKSSLTGEGGTATSVGSKKERVGEDDIGSTENIPIGAKEAPSLGLLGEESRLDLILKSERGLERMFCTWVKPSVEGLKQDLLDSFQTDHIRIRMR